MIVMTARRSAPDIDPRIRHMNEWERISKAKQQDALGINYFDDVKAFFEMSQGAPSPRYRPSFNIPELQVLMMREANDLSEFQPQAYIYSQKKSQRLDTIEDGFRSQWEQMFVPYHLLFAFLIAQFTGTAFLQVGIDQRGNNGLGKMWTKCRDPRSVHMDPNTDYTLNWSWIILDDWIHLDEVKSRFPEKAHLLPRYPGTATRDIGGTDGGNGFVLPPGPFQSMPALDAVATPRGYATRVRWCLCKDYTRSLIASNDPKSPAKYKWEYPNGRMLVECENVILADGQIPWPQGRFNLVPVWGTPPLFGPWAVPPTRYTQNMQGLAEKFYAQTYENFWRLNNGVWCIPESAEINQNQFGGVPGEKVTYKGEKPPNCITPPSFPDSATKIPEMLLQKQRDIHGFTQARQGNPGDGNLSPELFDAAVLRGQGMTQLRGRLASASVLELAKCIVYAMVEYMPAQKMPMRTSSGKFKIVDFKRPDETVDQLLTFMDDGSFHVKSQAVVARMAETMMTKGALPIGEGLAMLGYPNAAEIGERIQTELALKAVASVSDPKGKK
jgi:hypothetical protein